MKKSALKEIVKNVLRRKLNEISVSPPGKPIKPESGQKRHGVIHGEENGEPLIQVVGYGTMKLSTLKASTVKAIEGVHKEAKAGNYDNVLYLLADDGILMLFVKAITEVEAELSSTELKELINPVAQSVPGTTNNTSNQIDPVEQQKILNLQKKKSEEERKMEISKMKLTAVIKPLRTKIELNQKNIGRINQDLQRLTK